jgi:uncharacterized protein YjiS (DUF1127 family)
MAVPVHADCRRLLSDAVRAIATIPGRLAQAVEGWREHRAIDCELAELAAQGNLDRVLDDVGLTRSDIPSLLKGHPGAARQLAEMLERLGIAPRDIAANHDMREVELRCIGCASWRRCRKWLRSGAADDRWQGFCPNAGTYARMLAKPETPAGEAAPCQN